MEGKGGLVCKISCTLGARGKESEMSARATVGKCALQRVQRRVCVVFGVQVSTHNVKGGDI